LARRCGAQFHVDLIRSIGFDRHIEWNEFTVVTAEDIPGKNHIHLINTDQPVLADGMVNHCEEAIVLLAHKDKHKLREAVDAVKIDYEPLLPVLSIEESERQDPIVWGTDNILKSFLLEKGDVDAVWAQAAQIVEGEYPNRRAGAPLHREQRRDSGVE
jgi:xanthine dehydrogenase molybdopterin-binding subunit B